MEKFDSLEKFHTDTADGVIDLYRVCTEFAARHNNQIIDLSKDTLMRHPEIAIEMVENRNLVNNGHTVGTLICFDNLTPYELRVNSAEEQKVQMTIGVNQSITISDSNQRNQPR